MRQFDKDKIRGCVVECTTEAQCKELIDWYISEINPNEEDWELYKSEFPLFKLFGIYLTFEGWSYDEVAWYKDENYKILTFNEALLQTETKENQVQESKQVNHLFLNDEIALSKEDFIRFAIEGYEFSFLSCIYSYDDSFDNPFRVDSGGLQIHWININSKNKFKVVKSPYEFEWKCYKCIKNGIAYFVETDNLSSIKEYIQYDSIQEIIKEEN